MKKNRQRKRKVEEEIKWPPELFTYEPKGREYTRGLRKIIVQGWLVERSNKETEVLAISTDPFRVAREAILSDALVYLNHRTVSVCYWISERSAPLAELQEVAMATLLGAAEVTARYCVHYSDLTGYLYTDEDLVIGGHDLLAELHTQIGRWLYMEIIIHPEED